MDIYHVYIAWMRAWTLEEWRPRHNTCAPGCLWDTLFLPMHACTWMPAHECLHMNACTCMPGHECLHMHACIWMPAHECLRMNACTCMLAHECLHMNACTWMPAHECLHMHACTWMPAHECLHMHACAWMPAHACLHMNACTCMPAHECLFMHAWTRMPAHACLHMRACSCVTCVTVLRKCFHVWLSHPHPRMQTGLLLLGQCGQLSQHRCDLITTNRSSVDTLAMKWLSHWPCELLSSNSQQLPLSAGNPWCMSTLLKLSSQHACQGRSSKTSQPHHLANNVNQQTKFQASHVNLKSFKTAESLSQALVGHNGY